MGEVAELRTDEIRRSGVQIAGVGEFLRAGVQERHSEKSSKEPQRHRKATPTPEKRDEGPVGAIGHATQYGWRYVKDGSDAG